MNTQNSLKGEDSPYLQQHMNNPVWWNAWNEKAFKKAKKEDKLIFLSIGYSTCHWCHVMQKESFEDEEFAKGVNENFISIKIDREELPHIDKYYQQVYQLMNSKAGGWPLNIVLTNDLKPIYSLTYTPKENLLMMLNKIDAMYKNNKEKVLDMSQKLHQGVEKSTLKNRISSELNKSVKQMSSSFVNSVYEAYDQEFGGLLSEPKFPQAFTILSLLEIYKLTKNEKALNIATHWLEALVKGGIYDQIEGGFFRYSVDKFWKIPHFEKMLYTNAELLECYSLAYKITKKGVFKKIADEIVEYLKLKVIDTDEELFYSASDADSEHEEGKYFVFDYKEASKVLEGIANKEEILRYLNITLDGNFEANKSNPLLDEFKNIENLDKAKELLKSLRQKVEYPFIDNKIQTSWNSLIITSLLRGSYKEFGLKLLDKLIERMYKKGELYHQVLPNKELKIKAYFEDYSFCIEALLEAYDVTQEEKYLTLADEFTKKVFDKFYEKETYFLSEDGFKVRADVDDNAYKSSLSSFMMSLLKLSVLQSNISYHYKAKEVINNNSLYLAKYPAYYPSFTLAYLMYKANVIVVKSSKNNLSKKSELSFVYKKSTKDEELLACSYDRCFATQKSMNELENKIIEFRDDIL